MIVVTDAGPLHYLVLIGAVGVSEALYDRVLVPEAVAWELAGAEHAGNRPCVDRAAAAVV